MSKEGDKVVELRAKMKPVSQDVGVFTCGCGGQQFYMLEGFKIQCCSCKHIHQNTRWEYTA